jgi:hypothetical protein
MKKEKIRQAGKKINKRQEKDRQTDRKNKVRQRGKK